MTAAPFDPRITPARADLAARHLEGQVEAQKFVTGTRHQVSWPVAPLHAAPDAAARRVSELLFGEHFTVYEKRNGWAWGQAATDNYVGYAETGALDDKPLEPTHVVRARTTHVYPEPDLKTPPLMALSLGSPVTARGTLERGFVPLETGGWVFGRHLALGQDVEDDFAAVAKRLMGVPYLWGGRSSLGLDCSGFLQISLARAGISAPRDSDMQASSLGRNVSDPFAAGALQRGDLAFFPGHAGIMLDGTTLIHANAWDMAVSTHPLSHVVEKIGERHSQPLTAIRRLG